jgi:phosphopentomutase
MSDDTLHEAIENTFQILLVGEESVERKIHRPFSSEDGYRRGWKKLYYAVGGSKRKIRLVKGRSARYS